MLFYNKTGHFSVDLLDLRLVFDSSVRNFWRKKFHGNKLRKLVLDRENRETFCLAKFPAIQYEVQRPDSDTLSLTWPLVFTSTPVLRRKTTSSRQPSPLAQISPSDSSSRGWCKETTQECNCTRSYLHRYWFA